MGKKEGTLYLGTSGYQYDHWKGVFYPEDVPKKRWFEYYAEQFNTVEINNTFYNLPKASTFQDWAARAPENFVFALKFSRYGTHMKKLKDPENSVGKFMEAARELGPTLGPVLVQLPPNWEANPERLDTFFAAAPKNQRWVAEIRDASWFCGPVYEVLRRHRVALCLHDMIEKHPREITADWTYLRLHGNDYAHKYSPQALRAAAKRIRAYLDQGMDTYVYFNNDAHGYAVENAQRLHGYITQH